MDDNELQLGGMTTEQTEKVLQFQDLTGIEDVSVCRDVLQRHGWDIEVAVQDQLNIREGRPSMFAVNARSPAVVSDYLAQQYFTPRPRDDDGGGGITGLIRYVWNLVFGVCYNFPVHIFKLILRLFKPDPRRMVTDPLGDVMRFVEAFDQKYSSSHPVFYQGTYAQAVNDAKQELRFLLVFLHNENSQDSEEFCRQALGDPEVVTIVNQNMLFWACSVNTGEGYRVSQSMRERTYPFLAIVVVVNGRMTIVARMEGSVDGPELGRRLQTVIRDNEACIVAARHDRMERSFNQSLRAQQDVAYQQSLLADQEKERERREARQRQQEAEENHMRRLLEEEEQKEEIERQKQRLLEQIPDEPEVSHPDSVHLVIKLPSGSRLERRFLKTHSLQDLHNFVFCHPSAPDNFEIATNFPKRVLQCRSQETFDVAGIKQKEVLFVYDLEA